MRVYKDVNNRNALCPKLIGTLELINRDPCSRHYKKRYLLFQKLSLVCLISASARHKGRKFTTVAKNLSVTHSRRECENFQVRGICSYCQYEWVSTWLTNMRYGANGVMWQCPQLLILPNSECKRDPCVTVCSFTHITYCV